MCSECIPEAFAGSSVLLLLLLDGMMTKCGFDVHFKYSNCLLAFEMESVLLFIFLILTKLKYIFNHYRPYLKSGSD